MRLLASSVLIAAVVLVLLKSQGWLVVNLPFPMKGSAIETADEGKSNRKPDTQADLSNKIHVVPVVGSVDVPTGKVTSYTYRPSGSGPFPAIYFLQGYTCRTSSPDDPRNYARNRLIERYIQASYLVFMIEKPGLEDGLSTIACKDLVYDEEVEAFKSGFDALVGNADVDSNNVFLFGHSMGGQTAPLIAAEKNVRGIITFGIHAKPWFEFMIDISREQAERLGIDPVQVDSETALMIPFLYQLMVEKKDWEHLSSNHTQALSLGIMNADGPYLNGRHYSFWANLNDAPLVKAWSQYEGKVLAIYGEYDIASISSEGAERIVRIVNYHHPGNAIPMVLPKTGHGFASIDGSFESYLKLRFDPEWAGSKEASHFNDYVAQNSIEWMNSMSE